jgi:hypothetical protein
VPNGKYVDELPDRTSFRLAAFFLLTFMHITAAWQPG